MQSTTIIAFDQHAATTVAAVLLPEQRTPALHPLTSDLATILRFVGRLQRNGAVRCCYEAGRAGSSCAARSRPARSPATSSRRHSFRDGRAIE